jgi:hypothetical protein
MSELSQKEEGSTTVTTIKIGRSKLETIMDENTVTLAGQLLKIKDEIEAGKAVPNNSNMIIIKDDSVVVADNHDVIILD